MSFKKILLTVFSFCAFTASHAQLSRVQFINNCPEVSMPMLDVYVNGNLELDDIQFRTATPFVDLLPGSVAIAIAPGNSTSVNDAIFTTNAVVFPTDTIVAIASGTITSTGYNPYRPFTLDVHTTARQTALVSTEVDLLFSNGSPDAGIVDLRSEIKTRFDNIDLGDIVDYSSYDALAKDTFRITNAKGNKSYYTAELAFGPNWPGLSGVLLTSGFVNPSNNNNGPAFEVMIVSAAGGPFEPLAPVDAEAYGRVQFLHNSADAALSEVDIYIGDLLIIDDLDYRSGTGYIDVPRGNITVSVAPKASTVVADAFYTVNTTIDSAGTYIMALNGISTPMGYTPMIPFAINSSANAKEEPVTPNSTDVVFMHGATDHFLQIDITEMGTTTTVANNLPYGAFTFNYLQIANSAAPKAITISDGSNGVKGDANWYLTPLIPNPTLQNTTATILTSGFIDRTKNSNGPGFGLYAVPAEGGPFVLLPVVVSVKDVTKNIELKAWPSPASENLFIDGNFAKGSIISIHNITGKKMMSVDGQQREINVSTLAPGTYILRLHDGNSDVHLKFVKQ